MKSISRTLTMTMTALLMTALVSCETTKSQKTAAPAQTESKVPAKKTAKKTSRRTAPKATATAAVKTTAATPAKKPAKVKQVKLYDLEMLINHKDGLYKVGDTAKFTIRFLKNGKLMEGQKITYTLITPQTKGAINIYTTTEEPKVIDVPLAKPGWYMLIVSALAEDGKVLQYSRGKQYVKVMNKVGIMVDAEKIKPGFQEPADFQSFWDSAKADLAKVPMKVTKKKINVAKKYAGKFVCYDVKVTCIGDTPVSGYLTMPAKAKAKTLPIIVSYHGAGVRSAVIRYLPNTIYFDMNAHGINNGQDSTYYRNLGSSLIRYNVRNADDKNKFYFRNMYMRVLRSLDFVKSLPEWDRKNLIVQGYSQGGAQSIVAAALDPQVTIVMAGVPAMCDHGGVMVGRFSGWPRIITMNKNGKPVNMNVAKVAPYFDGAFFAKRIKAEAFFTVGLVDVTCVPTSVYAAYNNIPGKKQIAVFPFNGHGGTHSSAFTKRIKEIQNAVK